MATKSQSKSVARRVAAQEMDEGVLSSLLSSSNGTHPGKLCKAGAILAELDPPVRAAIEEAMRRGVGGETIGQFLKKLGHSVSKPSILTHKQGNCRCPVVE